MNPYRKEDDVAFCGQVVIVCLLIAAAILFITSLSGCAPCGVEDLRKVGGGM